MTAPPLHLDAATAIALAALAICLVSFAWAMVRFFTLPGGRNAGIDMVRLLGTGFGFGSCAGLLLLGAESPDHAALSLLVSTTSFGLFWWAIGSNRRRPLSFAFSSDLPRHLNHAGPYRCIRHPLYTAYLLAWLSAPIATGEPLLLLPFVVMAVIYHAAARLEERKFETSALRDHYTAYRSTAGMFWPAVTCRPIRARSRRSD